MFRGQKKHGVIPDEVGRASWLVDGQTVPNSGQAKAQLRSVRQREETAERACRSCVHLQVPPRISSSIFFLDKSLLISLEELCGDVGGRGGGGGEVENRTSYRSTLSVRLGASPRSQLPASALVEKKKDERSKGSSGRAPLRDLKGPKVKPSVPVCRVDGGFGDSEERRRHPLGSLSFPRPSHFQEQQEDTALRQTTPSRSQCDEPGSGGWGECTRSSETQERQEHNRSREPQKFLIRSRPEPDAADTLSLKEALELFRPDFISRSQGRMRRLEQRAMKRRALKDSRDLDPLRADKEERHREQRNCTTPDPLSDNLFKPRERSISGREMQLRSRRIYSKLPEVKKRKEAEKKRAVSQTNRLRVEVFKKRLLDQILQR